jgi:hypothetical protein
MINKVINLIKIISKQFLNYLFTFYVFQNKSKNCSKFFKKFWT